MKKLLSILLSIIISISTVLFCAGNIYSATAEKSSINSFIDEGVNLIRENDAGKEFVPEVVIDEETNDEESSDSLLKKYAVRSTETDNTLIENECFSDTAFQTCRLIVKASKTPDNLNSIGMASGFKDWYIIQFETEEDTQAAYEEYLSEEYVLSASPDIVVDLSLDTEDEGEPLEFDTDETPTRLDSWGSIMTGLYDVKDYIDSHPEFDREIVIGVVDVGVDLDNEFIKDRLIRTHFNSSNYGEENSEYNKNSHGTMVSSVIVDNTPENVKIKAYKFGNGKSATAFSAIVIAMIKAADDNIDIMNCSFSTADKNGLMKDALDYVFKKNITVIASAGNANHHISKNRWLPGYDERCVTVAGYRNNGNPTAFTSYGQSVDIMAPGQDVPVSVGNTNYSLKNGTSFSAPMTASLFADMMIMFTQYSGKKLEHIIYSNADSSDLFYDCGLFGYGIIDAIGSTGLERNLSPDFNLPEGKYIDEIEVEITAEPNCEIYYSLDGSYPSKESGILYTEPVKISDDCPFLKAVAYGNGLYRSECTKSFYRLQRVGTDDMFEISYTGQITAYTGDVYDLIIPETIDDITVRSIAPEVFSDSELVGITFPNTMTKVSEKAFYECKSLIMADGKNITVIENESFGRCRHLCLIDFPNVVAIGDKAFFGNYALSAAIFSKCKECGSQAFAGCNALRKVVMPDLISAGYRAFTSYLLTEAEFTNLKSNDYEFLQCEYIYCLDLPLLSKIPEALFYSSSEDYVLLKRLELSNVKTIESLPLMSNRLFDEPVSIVLPSTFESHLWGGFDFEFADAGPQAIIYGTRGTYAEQWANENGFEFIEITPDTAVIEDLPDEYYDYMRYLFADVVGFNRTYQWYGSYSDSNTGGIPIEGANERKFVPKENEQYPYYYCVVTSTDVGYDSVEICTGASKYMDFKTETIAPADYSALDDIIATIPNDLSKYSEESVSALNAVLNIIDRNLDVTEQDTVDGYVEALTDAIANLKLKEYTVSFIADGETILEYDLEYAKEISMIPPAPTKEGYTFKEWLPDIPETMPAKDMSFYAVFEGNKQPDDKPTEEIKPLIDIRGFEYSRMIDYRTTISFTAITKDTPKDASVVWYKDGQKAGEGEKITIKEAREAFTIQAKIIDKSGSVLNTSETELVKVKSDFFSRILAFFKALFKRLPVIEQ